MHICFGLGACDYSDKGSDLKTTAGGQDGKTRALANEYQDSSGAKVPAWQCLGVEMRSKRATPKKILTGLRDRCHLLPESK